ncbi:hypothetical protein Q4I28_000323 [Leishmania naiffi]|uniref:Uncharacterized protein n=1 Tax=Leishmania naiffi TaxID=5678 RepID=A0AAW3CAM8_9TRYP
MGSSSLSLPSAPCCSCVLGTLPDVLRCAVAQGEHGGVTAYLASELPHNSQIWKDSSREQVGNACASAESTGTYVVFEDAINCCQWTVELVAASVIGDGDTGDTWWANPEDLAAIDATEAAEPISCVPYQQEGSSGGGCSSRITGMRYYMKPDTWRQTFLSRRHETTTTGHIASAVPHSDSASTTEVTRSNPRESNRDVHTHRQATPSVLSTASSVVTATAAEEALSLSAASSPLHDLPLHQLVEQHAALVRRLVQVLAPQRHTISYVIREVCTATVTSPSSSVKRRVCILSSSDASNAETMQYTESDVAAAIEQLTSSHPRQPRLRELKTDGYLVMNVDGFADGKTRHKAVNRAYPALALHWPASGQQMDRMERYVDRDVVLDTRKRHPELSGEKAEKKPQRKRDRSLSSAASHPPSEEEDEEQRTGAPGSTSTPPSPLLDTAAAPEKTATMASSQRFFQSLREYPKSLEPGNLHVWARGTAAQRAREYLEAAVRLTQRLASTAGAPADAASLGPLPVTKEEDVAALRNQYDALTASESLLEEKLRAYRDTIHELRGWYHSELCTQQFCYELEAWLQTQEESRAVLTDLYVQVHTARYRLQRDLFDYLHLHALGVL